MENTISKGIILYAEDNENVRKTMIHSFERHFPDYNIESFEDGELINQRILKGLEDVCLVIIDNEMPLTNGSEIIKKYARVNSNVPFILFYGGNEEIGREAIESGAHSYFLKLAPVKRLYESIKDALSKK